LEDSKNAYDYSNEKKIRNIKKIFWLRG